jgi:hypothetical protein
MPIRINLLAAEQAAEESRRRDPMKRAIFGGSALVVAMLGWVAITQLQVAAARSELATQTNRLAKLEISTKQVRNIQLAASDAISRVKALDRYNVNRFLWGNFLDALQQVSVDQVRLTDVRTEQKHSSSEAAKLLATNIVASYTPAPPSWKFWASRPETLSLDEAINSQLPYITNGAPFTTNILKYTLKTGEVTTNVSASQINAAIEFTTVPWATENITVEIRGRDYGTPHGAAIDEFARRLNSSPYFKQLLAKGQGFRFTERPPQPRPDPTNPQNPNALFVPFTIELVLDTRTFTKDETL